MTHNDVYWDDAVLVYSDAVAVPMATAPVGTPAVTETPTSSPTPPATPTPRPDGAVVHVVVEGDTLGAIALQYGVSVDDLRRLNAGSIGDGDLIYMGQELVVASGASGTPAVTPAAPATPTLAVSPTLVAVPTATPPPPPAPTPVSLASICVLAYHDRDGDGLWTQASEEMLPGAVYTLTSSTGPVGSHTTDGLLEPYCFEGLSPGTYQLAQNAPPGYTSADAPSRDVAASATLSFTFGYRRVENPTVAPASALPQSMPTGSGRTRLLLVIVGALVAVALVGGIAFAVVLVRRRP